MHPSTKHLVAAALAVVLAAPAGAQVGSAKQAATPGTARSQEEIRNANEHVNKAVQVVHGMQANPQMRALLQHDRKR